MSKSKDIVGWKSALTADAKKTAEAERPTSSYISLKGGVMTYQDEPIKDNKLEVVIIANATERTFYDRPYDADDTDPPDCFAQGLEKGFLKPHANVPDPQDSKCDNCPMAEFGSAAVGKGPACKTRRKLMVMTVGGLEDPAGAELATIAMPPTSVKNYSAYANKVASSLGVPTWGVKTMITVKPHPKRLFEVTFECTGPVEGDNALAGIHSRIPAAEQALMTPYTYDEEEKEETASGSSKY